MNSHVYKNAISILGIISLLILIYTCFFGLFQVISYSQAWDFNAYYYAGKYAFKNPYNNTLEHPFIYIRQTSFLFFPFSFFNVNDAKILWVVLSIGVFLTSVILAIKNLGWLFPIMLSIMVISNDILLFTIKSGNIELLQDSFILIGALSLNFKRHLFVILGSIFKIYPIIILAFLIIRDRGLPTLKYVLVYFIFAAFFYISWFFDLEWASNISPKITREAPLYQWLLPGILLSLFISSFKYKIFKIWEE